MVRLKELTLFHILGFLPFLVLGLIINMIQLVLYLLLFKISKDVFRRINYYLMFGIYGYFLFIAEWWSGSRMRIYSDQEMLTRMEAKDAQENALIVMNHHYELDWLYCWMVGDRMGILGNCKAFAKESLKYVPILGWAGSWADNVYLKRNLEKDRSRMKNNLSELVGYPSPIWLFLFPEGTRFTAEKHKASQEFAKSRDLPMLEHHLTPRTKGFTFTLSNLDRSKMSLYDFTLVAGMGDSAPPTVTSLILGRRTEATVVIRKISLDKVPAGEKEGGEWMMDLFKEKDQIKKSLLDGTWQKLNESHTVTDSTLSCIKTPPRVHSLVLSITANILVLSPLLYLLLTGGILTWTLAAIIFILAWGIMIKMVKVSKVKKSM
jgi:lysophosphatidic acid acyltransferase/lysophosphatidylinositol acyltransferase